MTTPRTLTDRRRSAPASAEVAALERIDAWLTAHRRLHRLVPRTVRRGGRDRPVHVYEHRRTVHHPWAEIATFDSVLDFGEHYGIAKVRRDP